MEPCQPLTSTEEFLLLSSWPGPLVLSRTRRTAFHHSNLREACTNLVYTHHDSNMANHQQLISLGAQLVVTLDRPSLEELGKTWSNPWADSLDTGAQICHRSRRNGIITSRCLRTTPLDLYCLDAHTFPRAFFPHPPVTYKVRTE